MSSTARASFVSGVAALATSVQDPLVSGNDQVGVFLRRGLTVVGYNLLETFVAERLEEIASHVNAGLLHVDDLPEPVQKAAFRETVHVAADRLRRPADDLTSLRAFSGVLGTSLAATSGPVQLSSLMWMWRGSNMSPSDVSKLLRLFHVDKPWQTVRELANRAGLVLADAETAAWQMFRERNSSAHSSTHQVSNLVLRSFPIQLTALALGIDVCISRSAENLANAVPTYLRNDKWMTSSRVTYRFVRDRGKDWAEILEGRTSANKKDPSRDAMMQQALQRAKSNKQVVVVQDRQSQAVDWRDPIVP